MTKKCVAGTSLAHRARHSMFPTNSFSGITWNWKQWESNALEKKVLLESDGQPLVKGKISVELLK